MSAILFFGPGAEQEALTTAGKLGRLLAPAFGDGGLKVDAAREAVALMDSPPVGDSVGTLIIGLDLINPQAADVLLKSVEECDTTQIQPLLWATDLGGVPETIRSRCLARWSPSDLQMNNPMTDLAGQIIDKYNAKDIAGLVVLFLKEDFKDKESDLLTALSGKLVAKDPADLWPRLRQVAMLYNPSAKEILAALLEGIQ